MLMSRGRGNALSFELQQELNAAILKSFSPKTTEEAKAFISAKQSVRRRHLNAAFWASIGKNPVAERSEVSLLTGLALFYERYFPAEFEAAGGAGAILSVALPAEREDFDHLLVVLP